MLALSWLILLYFAFIITTFKLVAWLIEHIDDV